MRPTKDQLYLDMAKLIAQGATCLRRSVGCVLVNAKGQVLSTGYNGVASGLPHCNERREEYLSGTRLIKGFHYPHACDGAYSPSGTNLDCCQAIHAEQNALLQCRDVYEIHTCYTTVSPCITCVKLLMNTSCQRIVFWERYAQDEAAQKLWETKWGSNSSWVHRSAL
jgi:dCMP deaminase